MVRGRQAIEIHTENEKVMMILMFLTACSRSLKPQRGELFWGKEPKGCVVFFVAGESQSSI